MGKLLAKALINGVDVSRLSREGCPPKGPLQPQNSGLINAGTNPGMSKAFSTPMPFA